MPIFEGGRTATPGPAKWSKKFELLGADVFNMPPPVPLELGPAELELEEESPSTGGSGGITFPLKLAFELFFFGLPELATYELGECDECELALCPRLLERYARPSPEARSSPAKKLSPSLALPGFGDGSGEGSGDDTELGNNPATPASPSNALMLMPSA